MSISTLYMYDRWITINVFHLRLLMSFLFQGILFSDLKCFVLKAE